MNGSISTTANKSLATAGAPHGPAWLFAMLIFGAFFPQTSSDATEEPMNFPNGTWLIEATPPAGALSLSENYLPTGTRIKLMALGPTRRATEEDIDNELGGTLTLLSPVTAEICSTGLGAETSFGVNLCSEGRLSKHPIEPAEFDDAIFVFSLLAEEDPEDFEYYYYLRQGARKGARFVYLFLKYKNADWNLWLRSPNEMLSQGMATLPGKNNYQSFPIIWRRQPD